MNGIKREILVDGFSKALQHDKSALTYGLVQGVLSVVRVYAS
jgi:hypothetical protein